MISIKVIRLGMSNETKKSIDYIVSQLEKNNYVHCKSLHINGVRLFSRFVKPFKEQGKIFVSKTSDKNVTNVISITPGYKLVRNNFNIKIVRKNGEKK